MPWQVPKSYYPREPIRCKQFVPQSTSLRDVPLTATCRGLFGTGPIAHRQCVGTRGASLAKKGLSFSEVRQRPCRNRVCSASPRESGSTIGFFRREPFRFERTLRSASQRRILRSGDSAGALLRHRGNSRHSPPAWSGRGRHRDFVTGGGSGRGHRYAVAVERSRR